MKAIKITTDGQTFGSRILDAETGAEIKGVTAINIAIDAKHPSVRATVDVRSVVFEGQAKAVFQVAHPTTGKLTAVNSITFVGGETVEF